MLSRGRHIVLAIIDLFHRPFARYIPTQTFRYLACGGSNTVLNIGLEHIAYNFMFKGQPIHVYGSHYIAAEVGAWIVGFAISFPAGFILSRHIVFPESNLHGRIQLFRYALTTVSFIILTYLLIKFFAFSIPMVNQTLRYTAVCIITAVLSYISQRKFTFKTVDDGIEEDVVTD